MDEILEAIDNGRYLKARQLVRSRAEQTRLNTWARQLMIKLIRRIEQLQDQR